MGQSSSSESTLPDSMENITGDVLRHARQFSEMATVTYEEFQASLSELNKLSQHCLDCHGKQLVFAIKKGTDTTLLWKGTVKIACVRVDAATRHVESFRLLNLSEFLRVSKSLRSQLSTASQSSTASSDTNLFSSLEEVPVCKEWECCICLERRPEVMLPCAHSYCLPCIEQWNVNNKTCPICRETLDSTEDSWVLSEVPGSQEISGALMKLAGTTTAKAGESAAL